MEKNEPLISVIVPVYDVEKYLSKCLDSLLAQTWRNLEIIVVDDGSSDATSEVLAEAFSYQMLPPLRSASFCRAKIVHSCARVVELLGA